MLVYVAEPMDRRTWIKDDQGDVPRAFQVDMLKLNQMLSFRTGIHPYSVMTNVFSPVEGVGRERFALSRKLG